MTDLLGFSGLCRALVKRECKIFLQNESGTNRVLEHRAVAPAHHSRKPAVSTL
jgi:hypothetical protein